MGACLGTTWRSIAAKNAEPTPMIQEDGVGLRIYISHKFLGDSADTH